MVMLLTMVKLVLNVVVVVVYLMIIIGVDVTHNLHSLGSVPLVHGAKLVPATAHPICSDGLQLHANIQTFLEPAVGTPFPLWLVNVTAPIRYTRVDFLVLNGPLEEAFATFTSEKTIMVTADD